ncbi:MAG: hypothetical protein J6A54_00010 [Clostridia bacterium]|nr:hypothetical protein [Clostridia bacterium]
MEENKNINESNSAKRLKMLGGDVSEDIHLESDKEVKGDFWGNVWYRNKWAIIFGAIGLCILIVLCFSLCGKKGTDVNIMYVGPEYLVHKAENMADSIASVADDYNEDGIVNVSFPTLVYQSPEQQETLKKENPEKLISAKDNNDALGQFEAQVMSGKICIYLIDPYLYELRVKPACIKASEILGYEPEAELKYDDGALYFKKTEFAKYFDSLESIPDDTLICVIKTVGTDGELFENSCDTYKGIINFKSN